MPASKIVNEQEVTRWFEEGYTYAEMIEMYRDKYDIETTPSMWGNFRRRRGLARRITRDDELIPWFVQRDHRWSYPVLMLRAEARRRAGRELNPETEHRLNLWLDELQNDGAVIHYDPDTSEGFFYVPRREGIDTDIIRVPERVTTQRKAAD